MGTTFRWQLKAKTHKEKASPNSIDETGPLFGKLDGSRLIIFVMLKTQAILHALIHFHMFTQEQLIMTNYIPNKSPCQCPMWSWTFQQSTLPTCSVRVGHFASQSCEKNPNLPYPAPQHLKKMRWESNQTHVTKGAAIIIRLDVSINDLCKRLIRKLSVSEFSIQVTMKLWGHFNATTTDIYLKNHTGNKLSPISAMFFWDLLAVANEACYCLAKQSPKMSFFREKKTHSLSLK